MRRLALLAPLLVAACSQAPVLVLPEVPAGAAYKETGAWMPAQPADGVPREAWWTLYADADLDRLQQRLAANSPDIAAALARYRQARAASDAARASLYPTVGAFLDIQTDRQSELRPLRVPGPTSPDEYRSNTLGFPLSYEVDLWGRVSNTVAAGAQLERAAQADLASALLSLQAQLADAYVVLRGLDRDAALLAETEASYLRALELIRSRREAGIASGLDLARAEAQLESARSQRQQALASRALVEHAIAALVGEPAGTFSLPPRNDEIALPVVPPGLPSALLQRRPDVAGAQRRMAAANASVGVAKSAYFPSLTLGGVAGWQTSDFAHFVTAPNVFWALGPLLAVSLIDGGRRDAEVERAKAALDEAGARYRGVAIGAFREVEDNLALLDRYRTAAVSEQAAVAASQRALDIAVNRYREGAASYLEVVVSQAQTLQARRNLQELSTRQRRASVQLIRALGGGWDTKAS